jgi:hypothetical protein
MTSKPKTYQNYRFDELIAFAQQNPHRARRLTPIEILEQDRHDRTGGERDGTGVAGTGVAGTGGTGVAGTGGTGVAGTGIGKKGKEVKDTFGLKGYTVFDLQPTGLISMMVCMEDPHAYALSTPAIRAQQTIEHCTLLQQRTDELRNGPLARKRKRIYELLGAIYNESARLEEADYADLFRAMEVFQDAHMVWMNRAVQEAIESDAKTQENTIGFSSSPLLWKRDRPVWLVDARGRWMAVPTDTTRPLSSELADWLPQMAEQGWRIEWPEVEGSKTELVEQFIALGTWQESDKKCTKDVLAARLGKEKSLDLFRKWKGGA